MVREANTNNFICSIFLRAKICQEIQNFGFVHAIKKNKILLPPNFLAFRNSVGRAFEFFQVFSLYIAEKNQKNFAFWILRRNSDNQFMLVEQDE